METRTVYLEDRNAREIRKAINIAELQGWAVRLIIPTELRNSFLIVLERPRPEPEPELVTP